MIISLFGFMHLSTWERRNAQRMQPSYQFSQAAAPGYKGELCVKSQTGHIQTPLGQLQHGRQVHTYVRVRVC